jgi:hypothetical protein
MKNYQEVSKIVKASQKLVRYMVINRKVKSVTLESGLTRAKRSPIVMQT